MNNRIKHFDTARALSMLWIVCVWHLSASLKGVGGISSVIGNIATTASLATFSFISGYFMGAKQITCLADIKDFFFKRLKRFSVLYIIACFSMFIGHIISNSPNLMDGKQFLLSIFGLSAIIGPSPSTLWFFSMIILFYILTPLFNRLSKNLHKVFVFCIAFFVLALLIHMFDGDTRVLVYFPVYFLGLIIRNYEPAMQLSGRKKIALIIANFIVLLIVCCIYKNTINSNLNILTRMLVAVFSVNSVLTLAKWITNSITSPVFSFFSYISMCCYLFHSQVYLLIEYLFGKMTILFAVFVLLPVLFAGSYILQKLYDKAISYIEQLSVKKSAR